MFLNTDEPSGLIMFLGTPEGGHRSMRRTRSDDFMALEVLEAPLTCLLFTEVDGFRYQPFSLLFKADDY